MTIIGTNQPQSQIEKDMPALLKAHQDALENDPLWQVFGGILTIEGRSYQVVE